MIAVRWWGCGSDSIVWRQVCIRAVELKKIVLDVAELVFLLATFMIVKHIKGNKVPNNIFLKNALTELRKRCKAGQEKKKKKKKTKKKKKKKKKIRKKNKKKKNSM